MHLVFLLEELSADNFLNVILPKIIPEGITFQTIPHQGKSDLLRSIPIKLRAWRTPDTRFIVLHDKDANDCYQLKRCLVDLCVSSGRCDVLVRIACYELEAWYFGDLQAIEAAFPRFKADKIKGKPKYKNPDLIVKPSSELKRLIPEFRKGLASRVIPNYMNLNKNHSASFCVFIDGVRNVCEGA